MPVVAAGDKSEAGLMDADRAFAAATASDRLDGWMHFFADDAVKFAFKGPIARGKEAVREVDAPTFANPAINLTWEPTDAGLFAGNTTGFTRGDYRLTETQADGQEKVLSTGNYLTLWRHEGKGWKVFLDAGVADKEEPGDH